MIFYFLISIVFIAEVIIGLTVFMYLVKADKMILKYNDIVDETKPSIKSLMIIIRKISKQLVELAPMVANQIKTFFANLLIGQLKSLLGTLTFVLVKKEVEKRV